MSNRVLRSNLLLSMSKYNLIKESLRESTEILVEEDISFSDGKETYDFKVIIRNISYKNNTVGLSIFLPSGELVYVEDYTKISKLIGVKEFKRDKLSFYLNIDKEYDVYTYPNKYEYYLSKLNILKWGLMNNANKSYLEIAYADFRKEEELALASFCLLACPEVLLHESDAFDLYEEKLNFIGHELEDFSDASVKTFDKDNIKTYLNESKYSKDVLNCLLGYIHFIKYSKETIRERINSTVIMQLGYDIYNEYIMLID